MLPTNYHQKILFDQGPSQTHFERANTAGLSPPQLRDPEERPGVHLRHGRLQLHKLWAGPQQEDPQFTEGLWHHFIQRNRVDLGAWPIPVCRKHWYYIISVETNVQILWTHINISFLSNNSFFYCRFNRKIYFFLTLLIALLSVATRGRSRPG